MPSQNPEVRARNNRTYYKKHPEVVRARVVANKARNLDYMRALKAEACVDCGGKFHPAAMDFDHVRGAKVRNVSLMSARGVSLTTLQSEIDKCDLVVLQLPPS